MAREGSTNHYVHLYPEKAQMGHIKPPKSPLDDNLDLCFGVVLVLNFEPYSEMRKMQKVGLRRAPR